MAQHDYNIANQSGAATRSDLNNALSAVVTLNSGASEPTTTFSYMLWADTTANQLKQRNASNSAWVVIGPLATTNLGFATAADPTFTGTATLANITASGTATLSGTGALKVQVGSTAQRPSGTQGMFRFNSTTGQFEGYDGTAWGSIGGGASGGGSDTVFQENGNTVTTSYTLGSGRNAVSAGPITINAGVIVTVPSGASWVIV
jgi:hypothetical protein